MNTWKAVKILKKKPLSEASRYIHSILATGSHYPHRFVGTRIYELLNGFLKMAKERWPNDPKVKSLMNKIQLVITEVHGTYNEVKEIQLVLDTIREILQNEDGMSGDIVRQHFLEYVNTLNLRGDDGLWDSFVINLKRMVPRWSKHLFFTYDDEDIPKTNNQMEQAIKRYKMMIRLMTKRRNTSDVAVRYGASLVFIFDYIERDEVDFWGLLRDVTPTEYRVVLKMTKKYNEWVKEIGLSAGERAKLLREVEKYI